MKTGKSFCAQRCGHDALSESILTIQEVAAMLKVSVSWVYEHTRPRCSDQVPHFKMGKNLRFYAPDISDYLARLRKMNQHIC
jgi:predicted DNA-binding transcriptional regulator AlpA